MTKPHDPEHAALLEAVLAGERDAGDREVTRRVAECSECRETLAELEALTRELDDAGAHERALVAEASSVAGAAGDGNIEIDAHDGRRSMPAPAPQGARGLAADPRPRWLWPLIAAAAAVMLWLGAPGTSDDPPVEPRVLGGLEGGLAPSGSVASFADGFRWSLERPANGWFVVHVYADPGDGALGEPLLVSPRLDVDRWQPAEEEVRAWPEKILWEVRSFGAAGEPGPSREAWAERSSP